MSLTVPLFGDSLREAAKPWLEELGKSDRDRLTRLLKLAVAEKTRLSDVLNTLFYGEDTQTALANLTRLRKRLNDAAKGDATQGGADLGLQFHVDTKKQSPPTERTVWFSGPDEAVRRVTQFSQQVTADVAGRPFIPTKGIATTGSAMEGKKRVVRFFISYAHENKVLADSLVKALRSQFAPSKSYELELWIDRDIMVGEKWHDRILRAIDDCHFGLFMVSPDFLGSRYIGENEIPPFISAASCKPVIPVGLVPVNIDRDELKGLHENQIFFLNGRTFDQMRQPADKTKFARHLRDEMEKRLDAHFAVITPSDAGTPACNEDEETSEVQAGVPASPDLQRFMPPLEETKHFQRTRGLAHHLAERESLDPAKASAGEARDALDELEAWAVRAEGSPFFALLGEVGIGKTTTLKQFTRQLIEKRLKEQAKFPLPIYIDLRDYVSDKPETVPTIEELLTSVIQRSWRVTDRTVTAGDLLRLVREEGALIIFDGLDEKIVHLTQSRARDFIRTLWSVLPQAMLSRSGASPGSGKMLLSCRSHYFRDVWSQNAMLTGEDREGIDRSQYPAFCLLPFDEAQIRGYLISFLGDEKRGGEAFELIASIHNLRDLAERPYLLSLISGRLGELEALQMRGETVNAASLYDLVVHSWLSRDDGKHHLDAMHKRRLMEALAAALWRSGEKRWDVDRLEEWFDEFLYRNPAIASAYANKDRSLLKEDLRTATFVLRPDTEAKHFRFAHTSLQEYFLASHLFRALADKADAEWGMPMVSLETLDFLGQILATNATGVAIASLERILGGNCLPAACLAFKYWLEAIKHGHPELQPQQVNLAGADLDEWHVKGHSKDRPLNLRGANLSGVQLNRARLEYVDLTGADLRELEARQALFLQVNARRAKFENANVSGLQWRLGGFEDSEHTGIDWDQCDLIKVRGLEAIRYSGSRVRPVSENCIAKVFTGHQEPVKSFAWNPSGTAIATCSSDRTICVWEAQTGRQLLKFEGHTDTIQACAWSPNGMHIASASDDLTVRIWNVSSGKEEAILQGHIKTVSCCAWSPDGKQLASGSWSGQICVWDVNNRSIAIAFQAHTVDVRAIDWRHDGCGFLSAGGDGLVKTWDRSGSHLLSMQHKLYMLEARWSDNDCNILSGSRDGVMKTWNGKTGQLVSTIKTGLVFAHSCSWITNGEMFAVSGIHGPVEIWDAVNGQRIASLQIPSGFFISCLLSKDGKSVLTSSLRSFLDLWDIVSAKKILRFGSVFKPKVEFEQSETGVTHTLPQHQRCVTSKDDKQILHATPEAWRWLGWEERDAKGRFIRRLPAEVFGPIPGMED